MDHPATQDRWAEISRAWPDLRRLPPDVRGSVAHVAGELVASLRWEAAKGHTLTVDQQWLIAAQAALLITDRGVDAYARIGSVLVHGTTLVNRGEHRLGAGGLVTDGAAQLDGQTEWRGAIAVSWPAVIWDARHPLTGRNVVFHEFAHHLDMDDGLLDGTPAGLDPALRARWVRVMGAEFDALRRGHTSPVLRDYAATDPGEFFAVAVEAFFTRPAALRESHPAAYELLRRYFSLDPAGWSPPSFGSSIAAG